MKDRLVVKVYGSQTHIINILNKQNIDVYKAYFQPDGVNFEIDGKHKQKLISILEKQEKRYEILHRKGMLFTLKKLLVKVGISVGLCLSVVGYFLYGNLLYELELAGDAVSREAVMEVLSAEGIALPNLKPNYNFKQLEIALLKLDKVSSATVEKVGNRLKITFLTELTPPPIIDMTIPLPVISRTDAVVTRLVTLSGTALVKPGATVKAGATLIAPYIMVGETQVPVRGAGEVYGKVYYQKALVYPDQVMTKSRTGRSETRIEIRLGSLSTKVTSPYRSYDEEVVLVRQSPVLPIVYAYHTYYETTDVAVPFDFEREREMLIKEGFSDMESALAEGAAVLERFYQVKRVDNCTVLELYYETEELLNES